MKLWILVWWTNLSLPFQESWFKVLGKGAETVMIHAIGRWSEVKDVENIVVSILSFEKKVLTFKFNCNEKLFDLSNNLNFSCNHGRLSRLSWLSKSRPSKSKSITNKLKASLFKKSAVIFIDFNDP